LGGWFVGGSFTRIGGTLITNVAHLNPDLTLDAGWNARVIGSAVNTLVLEDDRLYVGGQFTRIGGLKLSCLAGLSPSTAAVTWNPQLTGTAVSAMQVAGDLLYVGGTFSSVGGSNRQNLAAISTATAAANAWNPGADAAVLALQVSGSAVYVGGQFLNVGGKPRNRLAALDAATGTASTTWIPNPNGVVRALAIGAGTGYAGGEFTTISVTSRRGFAALDGETGAAQPLDLQLQGSSTANLVRSILVEGNSLYVGGSFASAMGGPRLMVAGLDLATGLPLPLPVATEFNGDAGAPFVVNAMAAANGSMLVGGDFLSFGGVSRKRAAALSMKTGEALPWSPGFDAPVLTLVSGTNGIYVGGSFSNVNTTTPARGLALVDPTDGTPIPFSFCGTNGSSAVSVKALALNANVLYVGGAFTVVSNLPRRFVAAIDAGTAAPVTSFNAKLGGGSAGVNALALAGSSLYVAGDFTTVDGRSCSRLTSVSATTGLTNTWIPTPSPNQQVSALAATPDALFVGGSFTKISGITLKNFAAYDLGNNSLLAIDASLPTTADGVRTIGATSATLYVGGSFGSIGGENRQNLAALTSARAAAYDWNPSPNVAPTVIAVTDDYVFAGGSFRSMGDGTTIRTHGFFAAFQRAPQMSILGSGGNFEIVTSTGDRTDAVLQAASTLTSPTWIDIATNAPGFWCTNVIRATSPQEYFRVISR